MYNIGLKSRIMNNIEIISSSTLNNIPLVPSSNRVLVYMIQQQFNRNRCMFVFDRTHL